MTFPRHFLGLPLHPMLVHFPLVLWLALPLLDVLSLHNGAERWWPVAFGVTLVGVIFGLLALITGLLDYIHLSESGSNDVRLAARHGVRTTVVWCVMTGKLVVMAMNGESPALLIGCLVTDSLAALLLLQGAFFGTRITYGHYGR